MADLLNGEIITLVFLNSLLSVFGSFANLTVILAYLLCTSERETTVLLLVSLSVSDFLLCSVYEPLFIHLLSASRTSKLALFFRNVIGYGLMTASLNGLLAVTVDRFVAIYVPFKYPRLMAVANAWRSIVVGWILALVTGILSAVPSSGIARSVCHIYVSLLMLILPVMYFFIWREARKQENQIHHLQKPPDPIPPAEENNVERQQSLFAPKYPGSLETPHPPLLICALACPPPEMRARFPVVRYRANLEVYPAWSESQCPRQMEEVVLASRERSPDDAERGKSVARLPIGAESRSNFRIGRATKLVGLVLASTWGSWLLFVIFPLLWPAGEAARGINWAITAASVNSCVNPLLYCWMSQKFRDLVRKALNRLWAGIH